MPRYNFSDLTIRVIQVELVVKNCQQFKSFYHYDYGNIKT